jgi:hypothetical protein
MDVQLRRFQGLERHLARLRSEADLRELKRRKLQIRTNDCAPRWPRPKPTEPGASQTPPTSGAVARCQAMMRAQRVRGRRIERIGLAVAAGRQAHGRDCRHMAPHRLAEQSSA